jgi:cation transport regulator ChaC
MENEMISVFGYGSLMSPSSSMRTMPTAKNHRKGSLEGYSRIFSLVSIAGLKKGDANTDTLEMAALAIKPISNCIVKGILFDIPIDELPAYFEREHRYKKLKLPIIDHGIEGKSNILINAWVCIEQSNEEYRSTMDNEEWEERIGQYYSNDLVGNDLLWGRLDILPMRDYLINCLKAAYELDGDNCVNNLLDEGYIADGITTIREYISKHPDRITCECYKF